MKRKRWQRGLTVVELMIVLAVGAAIAAGALSVYFFQIRPSMYVEGKIRDFESFVMSLEQIKGLYGNAYPVGNIWDLATLPANPEGHTERLLVARIGPQNSRYRGWVYECPRNGSLVVWVYVGETDDPNLRYSVYSSIVQNYKGVWNCSFDGSFRFPCVQTGSTCR